VPHFVAETPMMPIMSVMSVMVMTLDYDVSSVNITKWVKSSCIHDNTVLVKDLYLKDIFSMSSLVIPCIYP